MSDEETKYFHRNPPPVGFLRETHIDPHTRPKPAEHGRRFGDYELESEIARGGMGIVYKAKQLSLNRAVALKMILSGRLASPKEVKRFRTEAEAAANLDHPHIVPIYEVGERGGFHFFSMKLIEGNSLSVEIPRLKTESREGIRILAKVCRAMHYAHQRGILHRDLKPANILIDRSGEPHITDFGLAKRSEEEPTLTQLTHPGAIMGTPSYMSPEQSSGSKGVITTSTDLYSLGAILYELLTGRPPFINDSIAETLRQVLHDDPVPPRTINPAADLDLETIALKCLQKDQENRYGSAEALAEELERWLANQPIHARRATPTERALKWARRRPAIAALGIAIMIVTVAGFVGVFWQWRKADAARQLASEQKMLAERALNVAQANLYSNNVDLAYREWIAGNIVHGDQLLTEAPMELRNWEWHYLTRLMHMEDATLAGHNDTIRAIAFDDKQQLLTASSDKTIKTWDVGQKRQTFSHAFANGTEALDLMRFSPNARVLSARTQFSTIKASAPSTVRFTDWRLWDVATGKGLILPIDPRRQTYFPETEVFGFKAFTFSPDSQRVVAAESGYVLEAAPMKARQDSQILTSVTRLRMWDLQSLSRLTVLREIPSGGSYNFVDVSLSPNGTRLALLDGTIELLDPRTSGTVLKLENSGGTSAAVFSHDNNRLVAIAGSTVKSWSTVTGRELWSAKLNSPGTTVFSRDDRLIAVVAGDGSIHILEAVNGREVDRLTGHVGTVEALAFSADDALLLSGGADKVVRLWNLRTHASTRDLPGVESIENVRFTLDGKILAIKAGYGSVTFWDTERANQLAHYPGENRSSRDTADVRFSADGMHAVVPRTNFLSQGAGYIRDHDLRIVQTESAHEIAVLRQPGRERLQPFKEPWWKVSGTDNELIDDFAISPSGDRAALATSNTSNDVSDGQKVARQVHIWNVETRQLIRSLDFGEARISALRFSPSSETIAFIAESQKDFRSHITRQLHIYDSTSGKQLTMVDDTGTVQEPVSVNVDGNLIAAVTHERTITIWDARSGTKRSVLPEQGETISGLAFSPDSSRIVCVTNNGEIRLWNVKSARLVLSLHESSGPYFRRTFTIAGSEAFGGTAGSLGPVTTRSVAFTPDGYKIVLTTVVRNSNGVKAQVETWDGTPN